MIRVSGIDHVGISSTEPERSIAFYQGILGMKIAQSWPGHVTALKAGATFLAISWSEKGKSILAQPDIAIQHFAFRVDRKQFELARKNLPRKGIKVSFKDHGVNDSLYLRDPDNHLIELACYEPRILKKSPMAGARRIRNRPRNKKKVARKPSA